MKRIFDSALGMVHYFIRPEDDFILNSLEKLDYDEYLYRLLRQEGYQRILFLGIDGADCISYAYDKFSHLSIQKPNDFLAENKAAVCENAEKKPDLKGLKGINLNQMPSLKKSTSEKENVPEYGKRTVKQILNLDVFISEFEDFIGKALRSDEKKTAVVMQMKFLMHNFSMGAGTKNQPKDTTKGRAQLAGIIAKCISENKQMQNVIVFTGTQRGSFYELLDNPQMKDFHPWIVEVLNECSNASRVEITIEKLQEKGLLVLGDSIGEDELAHLLLRKKLIEKDKRFAELPVSKVYGLARLLREDLLQTKVHFDHLFKNKIDTYIRSLNARLADNAFIDELIEKSKSVKSQEIKRIETAGVYVERVVHQKNSYVNPMDEEEILAGFDRLTGVEMQKVKEQVLDAVNYFEVEKKSGRTPFMNLRFLGAPGTGKSTVAALTAKLFHAKGILPSDNVEVVEAGPLVKSYTGATGNAIREAAERANGGVLVIDEFYQFDNGHSAGNIADEAMNAILNVINTYKDSLCIIAAGYKEEVEAVLKHNPGGESRFPHIVDFPSYSVDSLMVIFDSMLKKEELTLGEGVEEALRKVITADQSVQGRRFGNARYMENLLGELKKQYIKRQAKDGIFTLEDVWNAFEEKRSILEADNTSIDEILNEFDQLAGAEMQKVKEEVLEAVTYFEAEREAALEAQKKGKKTDFPYMNMQFLGAPGTGKTTVAKLTAKLLHVKGILPSDNIVAVEAGALVGTHVGETAKAIREKAEQANGGVLIIDEFSQFDSPHSTGNLAKEAIDAILSAVNTYSDTLCIIAAGYQKDVEKVMGFNDGSDRRFPHVVNFENYSVDSLMVILAAMLDEKERTLGEGAEAEIRKLIRKEKELKDKRFGNAGYLKNLIGRLEKKYLMRQIKDGVYTIEDVRKIM